MAVGGIDYAPVRLSGVETALTGAEFDEGAVETAGIAAASIACEGDEVSPAEFRKHIAGVLVRRALRKAWTRAKGGDHG